VVGIVYWDARGVNKQASRWYSAFKLTGEPRIGREGKGTEEGQGRCRNERV
jgi:hypothetical protein